MAILTLRDGMQYQEHCSVCGGIHITDQKVRGNYIETERFLCADCGHKGVAPVLSCLEVSHVLLTPEASETERELSLPAPDATNGFLQEHATHLLRSFEHWIGRPLMDASLTLAQTPRSCHGGQSGSLTSLLPFYF